MSAQAEFITKQVQRRPVHHRVDEPPSARQVAQDIRCDRPLAQSAARCHQRSADEAGVALGCQGEPGERTFPGRPASCSHRGSVVKRRRCTGVSMRATAASLHSDVRARLGRRGSPAVARCACGTGDPLAPVSRSRCLRRSLRQARLRGVLMHRPLRNGDEGSAVRLCARRLMRMRVPEQVAMAG